MADHARLRAVVDLAQQMAAARDLTVAATAAAHGARSALAGSFAALSVWERDRGRLRVLVNVGELAPGEEEFPADESYPVHDFPEVTGLASRGEEYGYAGPGTADHRGGTGRPRASPKAQELPQVEGPSEVREPPQAQAPHEGGGAPRPSAAGEGPAGAPPPPDRRTPGTSEAPRTAAAGEPPGPPGAAGRSAAPAWRETAEGAGHRAAVLRRRGRGACVVAPVVLDGRIWGELYVARPVGGTPFTADESGYAEVLAGAIATGMLQHERLAEIRQLAYTDPLTGLANRRAATARLDEVFAEHHADGAPVSLVVCDINGLKAVNDSLGHVAGDHLLERFGSVLSLCAAQLPGALAARLGGDEFCLVAAGPSADAVEQCAEEICRRAAALELGDGVACGVASTGIPATAAGSARRLFRYADAAQYRAKTGGSHRPVVAGREGTDDAVLRLAEHPPPLDEAPDAPTCAGRPRARREERRGGPQRAGTSNAPDAAQPPGAWPGQRRGRQGAERRTFRGRTPRDE